MCGIQDNYLILGLFFIYWARLKNKLSLTCLKKTLIFWPWTLVWFNYKVCDLFEIPNLAVDLQDFQLFENILSGLKFTGLFWKNIHWIKATAVIDDKQKGLLTLIIGKLKKQIHNLSDCLESLRYITLNLDFLSLKFHKLEITEVRMVSEIDRFYIYL